MRWKDIYPGDILKLENDKMIPADMILLNTSDEKGIAYVETKNLDGETNLKLKQTDKKLQDKFKIEEAFGSM